MSHLLDPLTTDDARPSTTPDAPPKPTSARRQAASRANGAKSHGPITPEGKARSSQNAIKHGLLADVIVLEQEDPEVFEEFARELHDYLRPTNPIARMLVDDLVAAHWRRNRLRRIESETYNIAVEQAVPNSIDDQHAAAVAFRQLTDSTHTLQLLNRYERGFDRQIARTLRLLAQWNQPDNSDCETTLIPEPDTPRPSEALVVPPPPNPESQTPAVRIPLDSARQTMHNVQGCNKFAVRQRTLPHRRACCHARPARRTAPESRLSSPDSVLYH